MYTVYVYNRIYVNHGKYTVCQRQVHCISVLKNCRSILELYIYIDIIHHNSHIYIHKLNICHKMIDNNSQAGPTKSLIFFVSPGRSSHHSRRAWSRAAGHPLFGDSDGFGCGEQLYGPELLLEFYASWT